MRKLISGIAELAGVILVILGLVVCMCETPDLDKQLVNMLYGAGIMVAGAILCYLGKEGSENYGKGSYGFSK